MRSSGWFLKAFGIFLALLLLWIASALVLSVSAAGVTTFPMALRSNLAADYGQEGTDLSFGPIKLSILQDALVDLGLSSDEADDKAQAYLDSLDDPVPTATAYDFDGNAPFTATPEPTDIPTVTPLPSATPTHTKVATRIAVKTSTAKPVGTAAPVDSVSPVVASPGTITPTPGILTTCSRTVSVSNVNITDAAPSSGIKYVKLKYKVYDNTDTTVYAGYIFSNKLNKCSGGLTPLGGWDACYDGPPGGFDIQIYPGFSPLPDYTGPGDFRVHVWLISEDNAGNPGPHHFYGAYEMPNTCDDPPPPTPTPVPTDSVAPSIISLDLSPAPGSTLLSCSLTVNDMHVHDPAFSSGLSLSGVSLKHTSISDGDQYEGLSSLTGSFVAGPGSDWDGNASGTISLDHLGFAESFQVYGVVSDMAGNGPVYFGPFDYIAPSGGCP